MSLQALQTGRTSRAYRAGLASGLVCCAEAVEFDSLTTHGSAVLHLSTQYVSCSALTKCVSGAYVVFALELCLLRFPMLHSAR
jgi:hypothetical protein